MLYVGKTNPDLWRARRVQPEHLLVAFKGFRVLPAVELHCGFAEDGRDAALQNFSKVSELSTELVYLLFKATLTRDFWPGHTVAECFASQ